MKHAQAKGTCLIRCLKANSDKTLIVTSAYNILYWDFPKKFMWNKRRTKYTVRQRENVIDKMFCVALIVDERFYSNLLLI